MLPQLSTLLPYKETTPNVVKEKRLKQSENEEKFTGTVIAFQKKNL